MRNLCFLAGLTAFAAAAQAEATKYPLTLQNCGFDVTFDEAPAATVSLGQAATEILYSLDLADKVAGTGVWFSDVLPQFAEVNAKVERLADNDPSFESIVAKRPNVVIAQYEWHVGPQGIVGTREQFEDLGIATYVLPTDCVGKDNTVGGDGTRLEPFTTDVLYQTIAELGQIFDVQDKATALVADLRAREAAAKEKVAAMQIDDISAVFWFSSPELDLDPYVAGQKGAPGYIMSTLGITNVVQSDEEWPTVGWETIARANPTLIVAAEMTRRRFEADDIEKKEAFLAADPVASQMEAAKNGRIASMTSDSMEPGIRVIGGIEQLADALASYGLAN
ncbi:MAG TPA: ABC transporter substrate-binding protein [Amaricoccus sp.]|uniref:ABC transporter substrate-binding protein n=1 Tax=Amaricoccus sp. TaxID=1872485 RepID=UPI002C235D00|nr:ABC transporter substrate-binding protein [Amaricoccus sp.]HMQ94460.1 ABC transporter substrate-binding protein [Amaricoccus sp.]HMR54396.1 ABC transporter substrate-binding protein [Amaricoccus sp.]HMR61845.1 ABC transporter substrate-binding protein [Amaricoccus sp.]HMU01418.1 ABC transporter substrate-binding protein [Amaricoccus sp.]